MNAPMSDRRINLVLLIAVVVAIGSGLGVFSLLRSAQAASAAPTSLVVVAAADIVDGRVLTAQDIRLAPVPKAAIPAGAFVSPDSVIGRVTRMPVLAGEPMIPARLAPVGAGGGLEVRIGRGKRAMPVRIEDAAAAVIQPNSRVDVILISLGANGALGDAHVIMANKRVLSVGGQMERASTASMAAAPIPASTMATLEVTPAEAERLAMAMNTGRIQFVLRGYGDTDTGIAMELPELTTPRPTVPSRRRRKRSTPTTGATADANGVAVAPLPQPAAVPPAPATPAVTRKRADSATVQVFRGTAESKLSFLKKDSVLP